MAGATREIAARWTGPPAPPVRVLPRRLERRELPPWRGGRPLGIEQERLEAVGVELGGPDAHMLALGDGESGRTNVLRALVVGLAAAPARRLPDRGGRSATDARGPRGTGPGDRLRDDAGAVREVVGELTDDVEQRSDGRRGPVQPRRPPYLVVDDYDLLAGSGEPLRGLTDAIAYGRDLGLHVVLARRVAGLTRASFEPFIQELLELRTPGLLFSGDRSEGPVLDGHRASAQPPGRGLLVRRGKGVVIQSVLAPARSEQLASGHRSPLREGDRL